ncbi:MAG: AmmeMemoRadiSam system protein B [Planctomycetes bacterium]|jgi:poly-gamma-glutamate synthesis protein (capsule biosynthesis protein)|nr:AmmeMemoRadiSam system protein B [Planctomycetota bacterium]
MDNKIKTRKILLWLVILLISQFCLLFIFYKNNEQKLWFNNFKTSIEENKLYTGLIAKLNNQEFSNLEREKHQSYSLDLNFYEEAYSNSAKYLAEAKTLVNDNYSLSQDNFTYGGVLPHHLMVKSRMAAYFENIKNNNYETVILISPDHFSVSRQNITISKANWDTPYGLLEVDEELANKLELTTQENVFVSEHGISGLVPFIKKSLPQTKILAITLKVDTPPAALDLLAQRIKENVNPEKTLVLASVDFSHYQPVAVADFHDLKSQEVIKSFSFNKVLNLEVDSPSSVYAVLKYLSLIGAQKSNLVFWTNSGKLLKQEDIPTTSHNFFYFQKGEREKNEPINFLFFGDLMLDRHVGEKIKENGLDYLFKNLSGEENRFWSGIDVISANLEGAVTNKGEHYSPQYAYDFAFDPELIKQLKKYNFSFFSSANNHFSDQNDKGVEETRNNLKKINYDSVGCIDGEVGTCSLNIIQRGNKKIAMLGFSMVYRIFNQEQANELIKRAKQEADLVIVNIHWGTEYQHEFGDSQKQIGHEFIDSGADLIIGHHPHVVEGMEIYKGKAIFYSLGNFIFDQYFSSDTQEGLALGAQFDAKGWHFYLFPLLSKKSAVELMKGDNKKNFLNKFIKWSEIEEEIKKEIVQQEIITQ